MTLSNEFIKAFAEHRNKGLSFSFLKENGELLSIAASSGLKIAPKSLQIYHQLYDKIVHLVELYPSFFRFFLAMAQDLETLGMSGKQAEILSDYVIKNNLYAFDTSDTRRMEIINLLTRSGREPDFQGDTKEAIESRVHRFFNNPDRFVKFNRPLFYEFTHLIFYITNYGTERVDHSPALLESLTYVGLLAYLDDDPDLLAEVCLCFKFLGQSSPAVWQDYCANALADIPLTFQDPIFRQGGSPADEYHIYFVINWMLQILGKPAFTEKFQDAMPIFGKIVKGKSALAATSHALHPVILSKTSRNIQPALKARSILSIEQFSHLETAMNCTEMAPAFFHKLTDGHVSLN